MTTTSSATQGTAAAAATASARTSGLTSAASQEDRFMKLLVAQLQNQDPLNPMDNAQMTSQVAQINTVGGIEKLNKTVESLLAAFGQMQAQSATDLPGRSVLVEGDTLQLKDGQAAGGIELDAAAGNVQVEIFNAAGALVQKVDLGATPEGVRRFAWDGRNADGEALPEGAYRMRLVASNAGEPVAGRTLANTRVESVSHTPEGSLLDLGAAGIRGFAAIKSFL